jgi:hypothetical protein
MTQAETPTPSLAEVLRSALAADRSELHGAMPGRVTAYDAARRRASVQPLIRRGYLDEAGERQSELLPIVNDVPVVFLGSGGARVKFPVRPGDTVLLLFAEASLDLWLAKGGEVDPGDDRRFSLSDGIAIPGLSHVASDAARLIEFTDTEIRLGGAAALDGLLKGTAYNSALQTFLTALTTFVSAVVDNTGAPSAAKATMVTAINTFKAAAGQAVSAQVKTS